MPGPITVSRGGRVGSSESPNQQQETPKLNRQETLIVRALLDENKSWDIDSLSSALGANNRSTFNKLEFLANQGLVYKNPYRLTPNGKLAEKSELLPVEAEILTALSESCLSFGSLLKTVKEPESVIKQVLKQLEENELVQRVRFGLSKAGKEIARESVGMELITDVRIRILFLTAAASGAPSGLAKWLGIDHRNVHRVLEKLEEAHYVSHETGMKVFGSVEKRYGITKQGRLFLTRYLENLDAPALIALEDSKRHITVPPLRGSAAQPKEEARSRTGEVKIRLLEAIANTENLEDPRYVYASLPYGYKDMMRAFKEAKQQGLVGENRVSIAPDAPALKKDFNFRETSKVLDLISRRPMTFEEIRKALKYDENQLASVIEMLTLQEIISIEKLFLTDKGAALLANSSPLSSARGADWQKILRLKKISPKDLEKLKEIAKDYITPGLSKTKRAMATQAKIIVVAAEGKYASQVAREVGMSPSYAKNIIDRFNEHGMKMFTPEFRARKPQPSKVKVRKLEVGEIIQLRKLVDQADLPESKNLKFADRLILRKAKIVYLSGTSEMSAPQIKEEADCPSLVSVWNTIHKFNEVGMEMFNPGFGLGRSKKPVTGLKPEELSVIKEMADRFDKLPLQTDHKHETLEYSNLRKAKIILLSAEKTPRRLIAKKVGIRGERVSAIIKDFRDRRMAIFDNIPERESTHFINDLGPEDKQRLEEIAVWWSRDNEKGLTAEAYAEACAAKAILLSWQKKTENQIIAETGMSQPVVNRAITKFNQQGIATFNGPIGMHIIPARLLRGKDETPKKNLIRRLDQEETDTIKKLSDKFDLESQPEFSYVGFARLRMARVIYLASRSNNAETIAVETDLTTTYVYRVINEFEEYGLSMFDIQKLLKEPVNLGAGRGRIKYQEFENTLFVRELTNGERSELEKRAELLKQDLPDWALWGAKKAKGLLMSAARKDARVASRAVGMPYGDLRYAIIGFNEVGMQIFKPE